MEEAPILLFPWRAKGIIISKRFVVFFVALSLFDLFIYVLLSFPILYLIFFGLCFLLLLITLCSYFIYKYKFASTKVVYTFTKDTLWIENRVYKFMPTMKFLFAHGTLEDNIHTNSCNTQTHELRYLIDPGENNDVLEKQSHFGNGITLVDRKWDYSYDHHTHKKVLLKNIRKIDWDKNSTKITTWIGDARRSIANRS